MTDTIKDDTDSFHGKVTDEQRAQWGLTPEEIEKRAAEAKGYHVLPTAPVEAVPAQTQEPAVHPDNSTIEPPLTSSNA